MPATTERSLLWTLIFYVQELLAAVWHDPAPQEHLNWWHSIYSRLGHNRKVFVAVLRWKDDAAWMLNNRVSVSGVYTFNTSQTKSRPSVLNQAKCLTHLLAGNKHKTTLFSRDQWISFDLSCSQLHGELSQRLQDATVASCLRIHRTKTKMHKTIKPWNFRLFLQTDNDDMKCHSHPRQSQASEEMGSSSLAK